MTTPHASAQFPDSSPQTALDWRWKPFDALSTVEVYAMLAARSEVFVVEQKCVYEDIDGLDTEAWHLFAYGTADGEPDAASAASGKPQLAGYLRVLLPDADLSVDGAETDIRIGRVLTTSAFRGKGLGNAMLERALQLIRAQWPGTPIRLHAQAHLQAFYGAFGFAPVSDVHDDDGIPHVWMRSA
ncbi:GNAT family N-acetyltransferase [Paraburkholderia sp.]|uniref:GNAT family N-acetyltransferase n=1 Tax=Paraburkholderia sp. TaxID=1926495 RepID=UPI0023A4F43E|nr:GNAT family N-acetyltransferase [Paraburkholderia sp.]MDE1183706.1 GNAT family N-acetyltransferase [Paraburkholderia sp.]